MTLLLRARLSMDDAPTDDDALWLASCCSLTGGEPRPHITGREWAPPLSHR